MAVAVAEVVNPADTKQRMVLYSNGIIESRGGAPSVAAQKLFSFNEAYQFVPPIFGQESAVALQVIDWSTPSGYTLDKWGFIYPWGNAVPVLGQTPPFTGGPEYLFGTGGGFSSPDFGFVIDFTMDPANTGRGYFLQYNGDVIAFGTGVTPVSHTFGQLAPFGARKLVLDWPSKRYWILDTYGRLSAYNGAAANPLVGGVPFPGSVWGRGGRTLEGDVALYDLSAVPHGWVMDAFGRMYEVNGAQVPIGFFFNGGNGWSSLDIVDAGLGATPLRLVQMNQSGNEWEFVTSTPPSANAAQPTGTVSTDTHPWVRWAYTDPEGDAQDTYDVRVFTSAVYLAGSTSEVQRITITGAPTGGTFTISFRGYTSAAIARNAPAATVQAILEAMPSIGAGNVVCAGGPLPASFVSCTFAGTLAAANLPQMTATSSLTGGTAPAVTITTTTGGVDRDPTALVETWKTAGNAPRTDSVRVGVSLANATYRAYVRVTDTSGLASAWSYVQWLQNLTAPNTPTVTPTVGAGLAGISLALAVSTAGLTAAWRFGVQYHDADWDGTTWQWVRGGYNLTPVTGAATLVDREARFGILRTYRALVYTYDLATDAWTSSAFSTSATGTLGPRNATALTNPFNSAQGVLADMKSFEPSRPVIAGVFRAVNRPDPIVVSDGAPGYVTFTLDLWMKTKTMRDAINAMFDADAVLLLRDQFGDAYYIKAAPGDIVEPVVRAKPTGLELTGIRDMREFHAPVQSVLRPPAGPTFGPFADVS